MEEQNTLWLSFKRKQFPSKIEAQHDSTQNGVTLGDIEIHKSFVWEYSTIIWYPTCCLRFLLTCHNLHISRHIQNLSYPSGLYIYIARFCPSIIHSFLLNDPERLRIWKSAVLAIDFNFSSGAIGRWEERPMFRLGAVAGRAMSQFNRVRVGTRVGTPKMDMCF